MRKALTQKVRVSEAEGVQKKRIIRQSLVAGASAGVVNAAHAGGRALLQLGRAAGKRVANRLDRLRTRVAASR